ncbi:MAG: [FeFe] hydrogenase H-cluster radical SAM maturase HydG [Phycisphaerae bacterium]
MPMDTNTLSENATDFINDGYIEGLLRGTPPEPQRVRDIVAKGLDKQPLSVEETAELLLTEDRDLVEEIFQAARDLKNKVYGNRIVLFAPLYVGSYCTNECRYCGFSRRNPDALRRTLTEEELRSQVRALIDRGHKRLILVYGEHPWYNAEFIAETVQTVYDTRKGHGEIRRVNINAAPLDHEGFRIVKEAGIGTYQIFQETYHHATYARCHPEGTQKADYLWRLDSLSRAFESGCDDVGVGALFGLTDWRFETLGLVTHALHLQEKYGVGPHTVSFPRLQPASGVQLGDNPLMPDWDFKRLIAILRLAIPYTGLILTARERPELRREVMSFGVSQIDAGSRIEIGGYTEAGDAQVLEKEQFSLADIRSLDTVVNELVGDGYIPSWCTACYRIGRTGEHFMEFAIPGFIKRFCTPNALLTLQEYLADYASPETREAGEKLIDTELKQMEDGEQKQKLTQRLAQIRDSEDRDMYF